MIIEMTVGLAVTLGTTTTTIDPHCGGTTPLVILVAYVLGKAPDQTDRHERAYK